LPDPQAAQALADAGIRPAAAAALVADRPMPLDGPAPDPLRALLDGPG
jgi:hypothetical protein